MRIADCDLRTVTLKRLGSSTFEIKFKDAAVVVNEASVKIGGGESGFTISSPGEYEVSGVRVLAYRDGGGDPLLFLIEADELSLGFWDRPRHLKEAFLEKFGQVDILAVSGNLAGEIAAQVEPSILIGDGGEGVGELKIKSRSDLPEEMEVLTLRGVNRQS